MEYNQLDISILNIDKYLTSEKRKENFLYSPCKIEQKTDGIKVTLIKTQNTNDNLKDFVVAYKGNIIYPQEFEYSSVQKIKLNSINTSQFKIFFEHLKKIDTSKIPLDTEFFIEFACKKPTLSSNYTKHGFVLLAYSKTTYSIKFGKLKSSPVSFNTQNREKFAKILKINTPNVLFEGTLALFERGIKSPELQALYNKEKNTLNLDKVDDYISKISKMFLEIDSPFGGKEEGVVISFNDILLKIQQDYQVDQVARKKIKAKFQEDSTELENQYWKNIRGISLELYSQLPNITEKRIPVILEILSKKLKYLKNLPKHSKKNELQILDDIQTTTKTIIIKKIKGNNNFLFLGKFRILTLAHYNIIKYGLKNFDNGVVCLVSNKETKNFEDLRHQMLKECFPDIEIIKHSTGHIPGIIRKSPLNINSIICGTDRYADYTRQLQNYFDISVTEVPRTDEDISATKIIENINNYSYFCLKTPKEIHKLYKDILKVFSN